MPSQLLSGMQNITSQGRCVCAGPAPAAVAAASTAPAGTPSGAVTPAAAPKLTGAASSLKRATPGSGPLSRLLPAGPQFRVSGLRRAGGIKLHNVGRNQAT